MGNVLLFPADRQARRELGAEALPRPQSMVLRLRRRRILEEHIKELIQFLEMENREISQEINGSDQAAINS